jgi:hypothetical protein
MVIYVFSELRREIITHFVDIFIDVFVDILLMFLKENLKLTFLELLLRISYRSLVVFRILGFFF